MKYKCDDSFSFFIKVLNDYLKNSSEGEKEIFYSNLSSAFSNIQECLIRLGLSKNLDVRHRINDISNSLTSCIHNKFFTRQESNSK